MTKENEIKIEKLADDYINMVYDQFVPRGLDCNADNRREGFISGYKAALTENDELQKKVYELEADFMALQEKLQTTDFKIRRIN